MHLLYTMRGCTAITLLLLLSVTGFGQTQFSVATNTLNMTMTFPARLIYGDFDHDGDVDVLYQSGNTMGVGIGYMKNNGTGTFTNYPNANAAGTPFASLDLTHQQIIPTGLFVMDYDKDGDVDILDRDSIGGGVQGMWVNNNGTFQYAASNPLNMTMAFAGRLLTGDFDNDGDIDVLYQSNNTMGAGIGYMKNNGSGTFTAYTNANAAGTPFTALDMTHQQIIRTGMFVWDYDNDGDDDIIDRDSVGGGTLNVWVNNNGVFQYAGTNPFTMTMAFPARLIYGDFDSDGDIDLLYQSGNTAGVGFGYMKSNGGGTYTNYPNANVAGTPFTSFNFTNQQVLPSGLLVFDYDGDGDVDIMDRDSVGTTGSLGIWSVAGNPPRLVSSNPANGATNVGTTANLVLTFSEAVVSGGGNMYIRRSSDNSIFETIATGSAAVTGLNTAAITVNPTGTLAGNTSYYLTFDAGAFKDNEGHIFGEVTSGGVAVKPIVRNNFIAFTTGAPLPVNLLSFTAHQKGMDVVLDWATASEQNADHFDVEYSRDGENFSTLGQVACKGSIAAQAVYQYVHERPEAGMVYYRLLQTDIDGHGIYSPVRQLFIVRDGDQQVQVAPNPVSGILSVRLTTSAFEQLQLCDIGGRVWYRCAVNAGQNNIALDMSKMPAGTYLLQLKGASAQQIIKILKQ